MRSSMEADVRTERTEIRCRPACGNISCPVFAFPGKAVMEEKLPAYTVTTADKAGAMKRIRGMSFWTLWFLCIMGGVVTGTVWANLLSRELLGQIGYFDGLYRTGAKSYEGQQRQLWRYIIGQRLWETLVCSLIAVTPFAVPGYLAMTFGAGFVLAVVITVFTVEKRWLGLVYWLISVFPHGLSYLAAAMVLTAAVKERREIERLRVWLAVGIFVAAGSFLEAWVAPWVQEICYGILEL